jgi:hypothetical protein
MIARCSAATWSLPKTRRMNDVYPLRQEELEIRAPGLCRRERRHGPAEGFHRSAQLGSRTSSKSWLSLAGRNSQTLISGSERVSPRLPQESWTHTRVASRVVWQSAQPVCARAGIHRPLRSREPKKERLTCAA